MIPQPSDLRTKARRLQEIRRKIGCITIIDLDDPTHLKMIDEAWMFLVPDICDALLGSGGRPHQDPAARSAAEALLWLARDFTHTEAESECPHCNALYLAKWALEVLGPAPDRSEDPQP